MIVEEVSVSVRFVAVVVVARLYFTLKMLPINTYVPLVADAEGVADGEWLTLDLGVGLDLGVAFALPRRSRLTRACLLYTSPSPRD